MSLYIRAECIPMKEYNTMNHPLREAVADKLRSLTEPDVLADDPTELADQVLSVVADALYDSVETTTEARKRTIVNGIAHRIERGDLP